MSEQLVCGVCAEPGRLYQGTDEENESVSVEGSFFVLFCLQLFFKKKGGFCLALFDIFFIYFCIEQGRMRKYSFFISNFFIFSIEHRNSLFTGLFTAAFVEELSTLPATPLTPSLSASPSSPRLGTVMSVLLGNPQPKQLAPSASRRMECSGK